MAKITMEKYGEIVSHIMALPRRNRDMIVRALTTKADVEDAQAQAAKNGGEEKK
jgi:hypothetical protein